MDNDNFLQRQIRTLGTPQVPRRLQKTQFAQT